MGGRKPLANAAATGPVIPPPLPPSVEEAYRRKCLEMKQRTREAEYVNDATIQRIRLLERQAAKARLERAFLLEQIAKRTSTNVEDSEGSPSPPPPGRFEPGQPAGPASRSLETASQNRGPAELTPARQPEEKPLRLKRGHRKSSHTMPSAETAAPGGLAFISRNHGSSGSDMPQHKEPLPSRSRQNQSAPARALRSPRLPKTAFELYITHVSRVRRDDDGDEDGPNGAGPRTQEALAASWRALPDEEREKYEAREQVDRMKYQKALEKYEGEKANKELQEARHLNDTRLEGSGDDDDAEPDTLDSKREHNGGHDEAGDEDMDIDEDSE